MVAINAEVKKKAEEAAAALARRVPLRAAYLFGSHLAGNADKWSDIDVAGFVDGFESWDWNRGTRTIVEVQKEVGYEVEPHLFPASWHDNPPRASFAQYVIQHGLPLDVDRTKPDGA